MPSGKDRVYWDTCLFLSYIKQEQHLLPGELLAINQTAQKASVGQILLVTSIITEIEILEAGFTADQILRLQQIFRNPNNCAFVNVEPLIARKAKQIRQDALSDGVKLKTPDSIHIASAVVTNCNELQTQDTQILNCHGKYGLTILIRHSALNERREAIFFRAKSESNIKPTKPLVLFARTANFNHLENSLPSQQPLQPVQLWISTRVSLPQRKSSSSRIRVIFVWQHGGL